MVNLRNVKLAILAVAAAGTLTALPASARTYIVPEPVFAPMPVAYPYAYPDYYAAPGYYVPDRPFSLHRFVGNVLGAPASLLFGGPDRVYYGY